MAKSRFGWAFWSAAPWCLGIGLVLSFTAVAGQDSSFGASVVNPSAYAPAAPADLVPLVGPMRANLQGAAFNMPMPRGDAVMRQASLAIGDPSEFAARTDEIQPRIAMKPVSGTPQFPQINAKAKGNPQIGLRPTFDALWRTPGARERLARQGLLSEPGAHNPVAVFSAGATPADGLEIVARFAPVVEDEEDDGETAPAAVPHAGGNLFRPRRSAHGVSRDGATPRVPRAVALMSVTPVPAEAMPIAVLAAPVSAPPGGASKLAGRSTRALERPDYASLIASAREPAQQKCLAEAIYFESRSEPEAGQAAVAQVVLNRARSGLYPSNICGVVYQNRHRYMACQFSFACEGKSLRITDRQSWATAVRIAKEVTDGTTYMSEVGGSTHYHANYVKPRWARALKRMDKIGAHIFYKLRPGQT